MKNYRFLYLFYFFIIVAGCSSSNDCTNLLALIQKEVSGGNLTHAKILADSLKKICPDNSLLVNKADSLQQIAERIGIDFSLTEPQVISRLEKIVPGFSPEDKTSWENLNWLEYRMINGEKRYFNRAASNLRLIRNFHVQRAMRDSLLANDPEIIFRKKHTESIIKVSDNKAVPAIPVEMEIKYAITVHPDVVPAGEIVRCWLPWPKESHQRQQNIKLIGSSQNIYKIAPDSAIHRTIYMEARAEKGIPLTFSITYSYLSYGQFFNINNLKISPYDKSSSLYKEYTSEQLPQICFTEKIRSITDSITGAEENPAEIVKKIYYWFSQNVPWAGALEYSIIPNIPEYVLDYRKGDCGMQTLLFMSMVRYKGIPVKWQSGWMMPPDARNLHDWCEVYFEGAGWIPVDISYGLQYSENMKTREFYVSGIDSYRLIVNDGISGALYPPKKFLRSEPYDFQRGEVEWSGGNLYFDKWDYNMKIEYKRK
jgi:hypothetical protein